MSRTTLGTLVLAGLFVTASHAQQPSSLASLKTTAEASDYKSTSTYDDVVRFMKTVADASPIVYYTTYGTTYEGRAMPMAVVGTGLKDASAASVRATGKLRVHIQGNIHAGEVEGKEAAQILLREFGLGQHADWLRSTVFLITPIFNADGNEKFALNNRPRQNGPINGMGTRANGQNLNINRDFTKLETPEARAFAKLWTDYDPHVGFDLHTSDGSTHGYYLTYSPPLNPDTSERIMKILTDEWFPYVTKDVKAKHGWDMFYYGNASSPGGRGGRGGRGGGGDAQAAGRGGAASGRGGGRAGGFSADPTGMPPTAGTMRAWRTFEHVPRFHNNYVGLRNRFGLLSEAYAYATFEDRIKATNYFLESAIDFASAHAAELKQAVVDADKTSIVGQTLGTRAQIKTGGTVDILMGEVEDEENPLNHAIMNRRKDVVHTETMVDQMWFAPTSTELVPAEYYVPAAATKAVDLLRAHGIAIRQLTQPVSGVESFTITSNTARPARQSIDFGMHELRTIEGDWKPAAGATVPAGAWAVALNQPLGRLAFYLLAPTSDDGVLTWNMLDELLAENPNVYPIYRRR